MSIDTDAFAKAERYKSKDGREFVSLIANVDKIGQILVGDREVTSLCQLVNAE